jgi:hypothetical protein
LYFQFCGNSKIRSTTLSLLSPFSRLENQQIEVLATLQLHLFSGTSKMNRVQQQRYSHFLEIEIRKWKPNLENHHSFPIYYDITNGEIKEKVIFPVMWSLNNKKYKSLTVAPLFSFGRNNDNTKRHYAVTPFYYNIKKPELQFPNSISSMVEHKEN